MLEVNSNMGATMFSIIISIISIALISLVGFSTIYYGSTSYSRSIVSTSVTSLLNSSNMIAGAVIVALNSGVKLSGDSVSDIQTLKDSEYLSLIPQYNYSNYFLDVQNSIILVNGTDSITLDVCKGVIARQSEILPEQITEIPTEILLTSRFGCYKSTNSEDYIFYYRLGN